MLYRLTPYMYWATVAYAAMVCGFALRKKRNIHVPCMLLAILADLSLVLTLELQRNAIDTAMSFKLGPWQQAHIGFSTLAVLLYFPLLYLGVRAIWFNAPLRQRTLHKNLGFLAMLLRSAGFILMFSMLKDG